jgi:hypothetical protein
LGQIVRVRGCGDDASRVGKNSLHRAIQRGFRAPKRSGRLAVSTGAQKIGVGWPVQ